ncbi:MAG TPA: Ig-like domain-containing protein [Acidobacteriota bacterium]|nr:Ig-like domain-containing protein [Acidobacteriota bacterium]
MTRLSLPKRRNRKPCAARRRAVLCLLLAGAVPTLIGSCGSEGENPRPVESILPPDTVVPVILSYAPPDGDTWVEAKEPIQVRFSEDIKPGSITPQTFVIIPEIEAERQVCRTQVACTTLWARLEYSTVYTVTLTRDITDESGNRLPADFSWSFTTRTPPPAPVIAGFAPVSAPVGAPVTIYGTGFDTVAWENHVRFNDDTSIVIISTDSTIKTAVPAKVTTGPIVVQNQVAIDTSSADFVALDLPDSLDSLYNGTCTLIEHFDTESADTFNQYVVVDVRSISGHFIYLDTDRQSESERVFCDIAGRVTLTDEGVLIEALLPNFPYSDCDTVRNPNGLFGAGVRNDTLFLVQYFLDQQLYRGFVLARR